MAIFTIHLIAVLVCLLRADFSSAALPTTTVCGQALEGYPGTATCPAGMRVASVAFAVSQLDPFPICGAEYRDLSPAPSL
jgi:hypothetical protein